jgi:hypothetical protein
MKPVLSLIAAAALAAGPIAWAPTGASAATHPRVTALDCRALPAKAGSGVWQARFAGSRGGRGTWEMYERTFAVGCFRTYADCFNWLYWQQSDWPNENSVGRCRKGMPYGF